jgi:hypothetical protein
MSKTTLTGNVNKNIVWAQKEVDQELAAVAEVVVSGFPRFSKLQLVTFGTSSGG